MKQTGWIEVGRLKDGRPIKVYYELSGNPRGVPVMYLHGGPGDHIFNNFRNVYDPRRYFVILFDQRGCGKSTPHNHLEQNTTQHLLSDMEAIRMRVQVEKMVVAGGSWGTSLAIIYAEKYPQRVLGLILRGVFDLDINDAILPLVYPAEEKALNKLLPAKNDSLFYKKVSRTLNGPRTLKRRKLINLLTAPDPMYVMSRTKHTDTFRDKETLALMGNHYESHHFFTSRKELHKKLKKLKHIPVIMVEGQFDLVTPMYMAQDLCGKLAHCDLRVVKSGHAAMEPETQKALLRASNDMLDRI